MSRRPLPPPPARAVRDVSVPPYARILRPVLLDTHALIWWVTGDERLPAAVRALLAAPRREAHVSVASAYEIILKVRRGKLANAELLASDFAYICAVEQFTVLPLALDHVQLAARLPDHLRDPFDRLLVAQSRLEGLQLVSGDRAMDAYGVDRLWS